MRAISVQAKMNPLRSGIAALAMLSLFAVSACSSSNASDGTTAPSAEPVVLKAGIVLNDKEAHTELIREVAANVEKRTEGRVRIDVFSSSQLGSEADVFEQASLGNGVIAWGGTDNLSKFAVPDSAILLGPYLFDEPLKDFQKFAKSDLMKKWTEEAASKAGLRVLAMNWYLGDRNIVGDKGYPSPDDLKGVLLRVPPSPTFLALFKTLDAKPTTLAWSEVYTGLSQGVVNAAEAPLSTIYASKLQEVAKTITLTGHLNATVGWTMSEDVFQKLSEADQKVLTEEVLAAGERSAERFVKSQQEAQRLLEEAGVTFVTPDRDAYREATLDFYNQFPDWSKGLRDSVRAEVGE